MRLSIVLRERGDPALIPLDQWKRHDLSSALHPFVEAGVVSCESFSSGTLIYPSHFVGTASVPGLNLDIRAKDTGLVQAMKVMALNFVGKQVVNGQGNDNQHPNLDWFSTFLEAVQRCVEEGLPWRYDRALTATSQPRGKIHLKPTIRRFASAGINHKVVSERPFKRQRSELGGVVKTTYRYLLLGNQVVSPTLASLERLIELFDVAHVLSANEATDIARLLLQEVDLPQPTRSLLELCTSILANEIPATIRSVATPAGALPFLDLERLWEHAVAQMFAKAMSSSSGMQVNLHGLRGSGVSLFAQGGPLIDPDVTISRSSDGTIQVVGDAKYKRIGTPTAASSSDLYQIAAYIERVGATDGFLVYVGTETKLAYIGRSKSNANVTSIVIAPESIILRGDAVLGDILNLPHLQAESFSDGLRHERSHSVSNLSGDILFRA